MGFEFELALVELFVQIDFDAEAAAWGDEVAVFEGADLAEDQAVVGGVLGGGEVAGGVDEALEHHDAWQDGEGGEMVLKILLGVGHVLQRDDARGGEGEDAVEEGK